MASLGLNTYLADSQAGVCITPSWIALLAELGVKQVRVTIQASRTNTLRYDLLTRAALLYRDAGISVKAVLPIEFDAPWTEGDPTRRVYPNEALGVSGDPKEVLNKRQNRFIKEYCRRAGDIAKALVPCGITTFAVGNENNLLGSIAMGANVPPVAGQKAPAMAPEVAASLWFEAAGWLHQNGAHDVQIGSLSWLPVGSAADIGWHDNNFTTRFLRRGLAYLRSTGVTGRQLPFTAINTNSENTWTPEKAQAMRAAITACFVDCGYDDLPLHIGEWGFRYTDTVSAGTVLSTGAALSSVASVLDWFQGPITPDHYGLHGWIVAGAGFVPTANRTAWWPVLEGLLHPAPVPQPSPAGA